MSRRLVARAPLALTAAALLAACSALRTTYPSASVVEFDIACARNLWPGPPAAPLNLKEAFCTCVVQRSERRFDIDAFDGIRMALARGAYRTDAPGVPPEFVHILGECRSSLDRGSVPVQ
jgi:hypothetical protein